MKARIAALALSVGLFGLTPATTPGEARAAVMAWNGTLSFEPLALPPVSLKGSGVALVEGPGLPPLLETLRLAGGLTGVASVPVTDPELHQEGIVALRLDAGLGTGTLAPFAPSAPPTQPQLSQGELPVRGVARLCVVSPSCAFGVDLQLTTPTTGGSVVGVGVGGLLTIGDTSPLRISVEAAPWTVGSASVVVPTPGGATLPFYDFGFVHGAASFTGSTALPGGEVSLVTPVQVTSEAGGDFTMFGRLRLRFVPEPGALVLIGSGVAGLALLHRSRS